MTFSGIGVGLIVGSGVGSGVIVERSGDWVSVGASMVGIEVKVADGNANSESTSPPSDGINNASSGGLIAYWIRLRRLSNRGDRKFVIGGSLKKKKEDNKHNGTIIRNTIHGFFRIMSKIISPLQSETINQENKPMISSFLKHL